MIYVNGKPLNATRFPDNTTQVWKLSENLLKTTNWFNIVWDFTSEGEFMELAQLKHLIEAYGHNAGLTIKYLPYGRQDKKVANDATFALHTFAILLNSLNFTSVAILDPHSSIATDLIERSHAFYPIDQMQKAVQETKSDLICYPDKGALTKYTKIEYYKSYPYIHGEKVRDQATGFITSYELVGEAKDKRVLIIDDICDGGLTFRLLAKQLYAAGATEVNLFVTHGIFSQGIRILKDSNIKQIFTRDGEVGESQNQLTYRRL